MRDCWDIAERGPSVFWLKFVFFFALYMRNYLYFTRI